MADSCESGNDPAPPDGDDVAKHTRREIGDARLGARRIAVTVIRARVLNTCYDLCVRHTIEQNRPRIAELCQAHQVKRLELFGSAARGDFDPASSDLDFLVEFLSDDWHGAADRWFGLQEALEALLHCKVDLVSAKTATNPYFLETVNRHRVQLYAA